MRLLCFGLPALLLLSLAQLSAADDSWNGKHAAVSLTYDDSLNVHLDKAIPVLDTYNFQATFYLTVGYPPFGDRLNEWRAVAARGHELGNHSLFHPCDASKPNREWVNPERDLSTWSVARMVDNLKVANIALEAVDGKTERTYAYPCGDMTAGGESYVEAIKPLFVGARGVKSSVMQVGDVKLFDIDSYVINGSSTQQLTALVDQAIDQGGLVVFLFHGVGGEHPLNIDNAKHTALIEYLDQKREQLWVAPMVEIANYLAHKHH
ncbi:polysaccharide deacetylase family protein [Gilvimarinus polysaccharolyticus]|uniref:polysaccharide deacetylase family protein n=1 Tax=Gilvimarinus polysaccharolyticus TaxID=863921 RepID=UPI00067375D0|nr:polysaccharide deacetylase family protein [Gilvimarinus polysaccharolyticus]